MSSKEVEIVITAKQGDQEISVNGIKGIDLDTFNAFFKNAKALMPEQGKDAWGAYLAGQMKNVAKNGDAMFVMSGIPREAIDNIGIMMSQMKVDFTGLMARMFASAITDRFHVLAFNRLDDDGSIKAQSAAKLHYFILTGLDDAYVASLEGKIKGAGLKSLNNKDEDMSIEEFLSVVVDRFIPIITITKNDDKPATGKAGGKRTARSKGTV